MDLIFYLWYINQLQWFFFFSLFFFGLKWDHTSKTNGLIIWLEVWLRINLHRCDSSQAFSSVSHDGFSSFSSLLCRRSWSRAPSGTLREWGWQRLNTGTLSASSCMWPQVYGSPTRHLMSNLLDWVHSKEEWVLTHTTNISRRTKTINHLGKL